MTYAVRKKWLTPLRQLADNWDGEDAPAPSELAFEKAAQVIDLGLSVWGVEPTEVDADVLGGIAVYFPASGVEYVWVSCRNNGEVTAVTKETEAAAKKRELLRSLSQEEFDALPRIPPEEFRKAMEDGERFARAYIAQARGSRHIPSTIELEQRIQRLERRLAKLEALLAPEE